MTALTKSQLSALLWLRNRNGDGVFDKHRVLVAAGEKAPIMYSTWLALESAHMVEFYMNNKRFRVTEVGKAVNMGSVAESQSRWEIET